MFVQPLSRRSVLAGLGNGFAGLALGSLVQPEARAAGGAASLTQRPQTFSGPARAVIQLFMHGGPSHVDLLDPKPMLDRYHGTTPPAEIDDDEDRTKYLMGTPFPFRPHGHSGLEFSSALPHIARHADDIAVIRSMFTEHRNHEQAIWMANTGLIRPGRPNIGSWVAYGLGSETNDLPAYVALPDPVGLPVDGARNWSSGWLPPRFQGTVFREQGSPVLNLQPKQPRPPAIEEARASLLRQLNDQHLASRPGELELEARIETFELAGRMQLAATDALDLSQETKTTQKLYGLDDPTTKSYGTRCLMARRLVEQGVRFVQVWHGSGQPWDNHDDIEVNHRRLAKQCDQGIGALLKDLKQRGLLDETLVLFGGEFGRTPTVELPTPGSNAGKINGRDHNHHGFTMWMAGGGAKGGTVYGATDEFGFRAEVNRMHVHDLHATMLAMLGFDHEKFTFRQAGRDFRLTDVHGKVIHDLIA